MFAIDDSASIFCARVMRGTWSIAIAVTLRVGEPLDQRLVLTGPQEADEGGAGPHERGLMNAERRMLMGRLDLEDDIGLPPDLFGVGDRRPRAGVVVVEKRGALAGVGFHENVEPELLQLGDGLRSAGDTALPGT